LSFYLQNVKFIFKVLKAIGSPDEYLFEGLKSVLSLHAQIVFKFFACLVQGKNEVSACFFENGNQL
jgi:hypothetical protein